MADPVAVRHPCAVPLSSRFSPREVGSIVSSGAWNPYATGGRTLTRGETGIPLSPVLDGRSEVRTGGRAISALEPGTFSGEVALFVAHLRRDDVVAASPRPDLVLSRWESRGARSLPPEVLRTRTTGSVRPVRSTPGAMGQQSRAFRSDRALGNRAGPNGSDRRTP